MDKLVVGIIFGGRSAEHEISLQSAKNVISAIDKNKYDVVLIGIDKNGKWYLNDTSKYLLNENNPQLIQLNKSNTELALIPGELKNKFIAISEDIKIGPIDAVFPVLHGTYGEDGTIQGLLKLANIPFVGASVLGSAIGMDKEVTKRLLRDAGIPTAKFMTVHQGDEIDAEKIIRNLGLPLFVKPANLGSSVGISKVKNTNELIDAAELAFEYDRKIIIEESVNGREIECSVLGNEKPIASIPGEIIPKHEFYSYEAKYIDENGAILEIPAKISEKERRSVQEIAVNAFKVLCCEGMARVDLFLKESGEILISEINTIPGFTKISMYPKLWELSGISYGELIDRLIQLAIERHDKEQRLKTNYK
jgi:D-alanine-D-alanine ligase